MPNSNLSEESFFFLPIDSVCRTSVVTCSADISIVAASRLMHEQNIAGLVVVEEETPVGILSVRDPQRLPAKLQNQLREALRGVNQFLRIIREHYQIDLIPD